MAEDITDVYIATEAGDAGWQSLTEIVAAEVEAELPISSADGTVVLDSPSANTFTVSTGGAERVRVDANGRFLVGENAGENPAFDTHFHKSGNYQLTVQSVSGVSQIKLIAGNDMFYDTVDPIASVWRKTYYNFDTTASINAMTVDSSGNLAVAGQVRTSTVKGPADTDAQLILESSQAQIKTHDDLSYTPTQPDSIATKKIVDDKIWVGTTAEYNAIATKNPTTLYCLTD